LVNAVPGCQNWKGGAYYYGERADDPNLYSEKTKDIIKLSWRSIVAAKADPELTQRRQDTLVAFVNKFDTYTHDEFESKEDDSVDQLLRELRVVKEEVKVSDKSKILKVKNLHGAQLATMAAPMYAPNPKIDAVLAAQTQKEKEKKTPAATASVKADPGPPAKKSKMSGQVGNKSGKKSEWCRDASVITACQKTCPGCLKLMAFIGADKQADNITVAAPARKCIVRQV
jgi:hypothetical protein